MKRRIIALTAIIAIATSSFAMADSSGMPVQGGEVCEVNTTEYTSSTSTNIHLDIENSIGNISNLRRSNKVTEESLKKLYNELLKLEADSDMIIDYDREAYILIKVELYIGFIELDNNAYTYIGNVEGVLKQIKDLNSELMELDGLDEAVARRRNGMRNFRVNRSYDSNTFSDIKATDWFNTSVQMSYEMGIINGKGEDTFDPSGDLLIIEAIVLASKIHSLYNGGNAEFESGSVNWYDGIVKYADDNNILEGLTQSDMQANATRAQMVHIFSQALPSSEFSGINSITQIPDVKGTTNHASSIFQFYNAGIVGGSDAIGTFNPTADVSRAEASAIIMRVVKQSERKVLNLTPSTVVTAPIVVEVEEEVNTPEVVHEIQQEAGLLLIAKGTAVHNDGVVSSDFYVKYGDHTYGSHNQKEYDAVIGYVSNIVEELADSEVDTDSFLWKSIMEVKAGTATDKITTIINNTLAPELMEMLMTDDMDSLKDMLTLSTGIGMAKSEFTVSNSESAYSGIFGDGADCNGASHLMSALFDVMGYNTQQFGNTAHAWTEAEINGTWYSTDGKIDSSVNAKGSSYNYELSSKTFQ